MLTKTNELLPNFRSIKAAYAASQMVMKIRTKRYVALTDGSNQQQQQHLPLCHTSSATATGEGFNNWSQHMPLPL